MTVLLVMALVDYAEPVAFGVGEHDEARRIREEVPVDSHGTKQSPAGPGPRPSTRLGGPCQQRPENQIPVCGRR